MRGILLTVMLLVLPSPVFAYTPGEPVTIVYNQGIAPIKFTNRDGNPSGILNEYWQLLSKRTGIEFVFREVETFGESLDLVRRGEVNLHAGLFFTEERNTYLAYSEPIFDLRFHIYAAADLSPPQSLKETKGLLVGVVTGGYPEKFVEKVVPARHVVKYKDYKSMFNAVLNGDIKAFVASDIHLNYYLSVRNLANPFRHSGHVLFQQSYYGATAKENHALIAMIKQGQNQIHPSHRQQLNDRWLNFKVSQVDSAPLHTLSRKEINWIKSHPVLKVSNESNWPPFDFNEAGQPLGFSIDLLNIISKRVGLTLNYIHGYSWNELQEMLRFKQIDIIHSLNRSELREQFILFTDPYISNQTIIVTSKDNNTIKNTSDLPYKRIAVIDGYNQKKVLKTSFEGVNFVSVESPLAALRAVSSGRADATIRFNAVANYLIKHHLLTNLKYTNEFDVEGDNLKKLHIGVRKDWPVLQSILQKGLDSITQEEMNSLKEKWFFLDTENSELKRISLTQEEQNWIRSHGEIRLGADFNWPPFEFEDDKGAHSGLASDYINIIEQRSGLKIKVKTGVWSGILSQMKRGELDGLSCAVKTAERSTYLDFSKPYINVPLVIITQKDRYDIHNLGDLKGKTVSLNKSSYLHEWIQQHHPKIKLHLSTSNEESIEAVSYGEVDAYLGNLAVASYLIRKRLLTNLKVVKKLENMSTATCFATDKSHPVLMGIVQKVLDSITDREHKAILDKWYMTAAENKVSLTNKEQKWIKEHPVVKLSGDPAWAPMSYRNKKNQYVGIVPEFFQLIEEKSGLDFEMVRLDNRGGVLQAFRDGKIDVIDAITQTPQRGEIMDFTNVYMTGDVVIITRDDINFIRGLGNIGDRVVGTVKDYITASFIKADFPDMNLMLYTTASDGLKALSAGDVDVFVVDIPTFEHYTKESSLTNLKISGLTPYSFKLSIGVRKGQRELVSILNKTLGQITQKETNDIYSNWVILEEPLIDYSLLGKVALVAFVCLGAIGYWNRRLAQEASLRKKAEAAAVKAAKAKSDFLANMSHEIRTPMNSVLGFAELLDNMVSDPEQRSYLKSIRTSGNSLLGIINDILDLSKIEAGKMPLNPEPVSIEEIFEETNEFFKNRMEQKQLLFNYESAPGFPAYILMDGTRLQQVLVNLIANALKFTETGTIDLVAGDVRMSDNGRSINFSISVSDTGIGIREEQLESIFQKFEQQEDQDTARYGGTGLGLSICKKLVEMMGGMITAESTPGKGSSFYIHFEDIPVTAKTQKKYERKVLSPSGFTAANVLVADDIRDNRFLLTGFFQGSALKVHEAKDGRQALQILRHTGIDLIFLDLRMPVMNGYDTISAIRNDKDLKHIPVIAVTASVMNEDMNKVDQYGFDGYLRKPVQRQELLHLAAKFLPYEDKNIPDRTESEPDFPAVPAEQMDHFLTKAEKELLPEWHRVKDRGNFEMIDHFASQLKEQATEFGIHRMIHYAEHLQQHVTNFDILEVDGLMKRFPNMVKTLHQGTTDQERG